MTSSLDLPVLLNGRLKQCIPRGCTSREFNSENYAFRHKNQQPISRGVASARANYCIAVTAITATQRGGFLALVSSSCQKLTACTFHVWRPHFLNQLNINVSNAKQSDVHGRCEMFCARQKVGGCFFVAYSAGPTMSSDINPVSSPRGVKIVRRFKNRPGAFTRQRG